MAESLQNSVPNIQAVHINFDALHTKTEEGIYTQYGIEVNLNVTLYDILLNMDNLKHCFVVVTCKILIIRIILTKAGNYNALSRAPYLLLAH